MSKYRASETIDYHRCPMLWDLRRKSWRPAKVRYVDVAALIGTCIHAGVELMNYVQKERSSLPRDYIRIDDMIEAARKTWLHKAKLLEPLPFDPSNKDAARNMWYNGPERIEAALRVYHALDPFADYEILDVERKLPAFGNTTLDLGLRDPDGNLGQVDFKTKRFYNKWLREGFLEEFKTSYQQAQYTCGYAEEMNEELTWFGLGLFDLYPKVPKFELIKFPVDYGLMAMFRTSAALAWDDMTEIDAGRRPLTMTAEHTDRWGVCPFKRLCFGQADVGEFIQLRGV